MKYMPELTYNTIILLDDIRINKETRLLPG